MSKFVVVDIETTGNSYKRGDKIIQFAAVTIENNQITNTYSTYINPLQSIPSFIEQFTQINDEMVQDAPQFHEVAHEIVNLFDGAYFVAHNVLFDLQFLQNELESCEIEWKDIPYLDTVELARIGMPNVDSYQLNEIAKVLGYNHDRPHRADSDATVTAEILLYMIEKFKQLPLLTLEQLKKQSNQLKGYIDLFFTELISEKKAVANLPGSFEIHHGIVVRSLDKVTYKTNKRLIYPVPAHEKEELFRRSGLAFEKREEQFRYMDEVYESLKNGKRSLFEAATGVGKTLAYLIAATIFSNQTGEKVIISTNTTTLQDQLIHKDIPMLEHILDEKVNTSILKGRNHYIQLQKFSRTLPLVDEIAEVQLTKMQILVWLTETVTGDLDELNLSTAGRNFIEEIKYSQYHLEKKKSTFDYYALANKKTEEAQLIITNHAMVLNLWKRENDILGTKYYIFDEGHHLPSITRQVFGNEIHYKKIRYFLNQIGTMEQQNCLYDTIKIIERYNWKNDFAMFSFEVNELITDLLFSTEKLFKDIAQMLQRDYFILENDQKIIVTLEQLRKADLDYFKESTNKLNELLSSFIQLLQEISEAIKTNKYSKLNDSELRKVNYFLVLLEQMETFYLKVDNLFGDHPNELQWLELDLKTQLASYHVSPISIQTTLMNKWSEVESVILTSATLTVNNKFDFFKKELGMDLLQVNELSLPSPFDYSEQMKFFIPDDLPKIKNEKNEDFIFAMTEHIISIAESSQGRMLILFTSHEMLRMVYYLLKESEFLDDFSIQAQGITSGSRTKLQKNFQKIKKSILLGTNSFWEGIDIPGDALSCLVIVRLPFTVPNDPVVSKIYAQLKSEGRNPFMEYSINEAIIRFRQGIGRLIRSKTDKGILFVFDTRLLTSNYGKIFLKSIPVEPEVLSIQQITNRTSDWLGKTK